MAETNSPPEVDQDDDNLTAEQLMALALFQQAHPELSTPTSESSQPEKPEPSESPRKPFQRVYDNI
jgi:hypothetical protein